MSASIATKVKPVAAAKTKPLAFTTLAELHERLGKIPLERIRMMPPPGTATEEDLLYVLDHEDRICELIDGTLVEKTMGYYESAIAMALGYFLQQYLNQHDLGIVLGPDGTLRIVPDQIREADVAFLSWRHFPGRVLPAEPVPAIAPDLAVEVLSKGNTPAEMNRKLKDYFTAGVKLVWFIDPESESATVYESPRKSRKLSLADALKGGKVLPGFELPLKELFKKAGRRSRRKK
jgi:Uma2 family endonuclease